MSLILNPDIDNARPINKNALSLIDIRYYFELYFYNIGKGKYELIPNSALVQVLL
ncbi:MAG: hypothetical protein KAQ62_07170 [Cyclobacteriaceae bacterium]|nr:hypothetical protein [Cyclobacteriaceae bacterium]